MKLTTKRAIFGIVIFIAIYGLIYFCVKYYYKHQTEKTILKDKFTQKKLRFEDISKPKTTEKTKLKILIIQDGAYDKYPEYIKYTKLINKAYCEKWGYEYKFIEHKLDEMPPYWLKVYDINEYIQKNIYDYVGYLDCDAIFYDFDYSIEDVLSFIHERTDKYFDVYIGQDPSFFTVLNTGVFLFKKTDFSKKLVESWLNACMNSEKQLTNRCNNWSFNNKKWTCKNCDWAGINYEQGVLNQLYELYPENIALLEESFLSNLHIKRDSYILHAMDKSSSTRLDIFKDLYEKLIL